MNGIAIPVWRMGMWWFLASEVVLFGGLISSYILYRFHHPEWAAEAARTIQWVGATNTVVLLTSSLAVILSHHRVIEEKDYKGGSLFLGITILLGFVFLGFKGYEYYHEIAAGLVPAKSLFWSFYFLMTGLHGLHVLGGLIANVVVFFGLRRGFAPQRIESVGIYWHFVDIVWIILFPLLYLTSSGGLS